MAAKPLLGCLRHAQISILISGSISARSLLPTSFTCVQQVRHRRYPRFNLRPSLTKPWHVRKWTEKRDTSLTPDNEEFVRDIIVDNYAGLSKVESPLKDGPWERHPFVRGTRRTGVLALKLGQMTQWTKDGESFDVTLLQVLDNHVINYVPPEIYATYPSFRPHQGEKFGLQIVGALSCDPRLFSKAYNNLFAKAGVPPKRWLTRFLVTPNAAVQPGLPLSVNHFRVGDYVDVQARTRDWGFQGVIKRWGMKGMPATHGVTKSHRKMGSTGGGGAKGGIWRGKKMPGIMGNRFSTQYGLKIWRINTKYNLLYVTGSAVAGLPHTFARISDSLLPLKRTMEENAGNLPMPTWFPEDETEPIPDEIFDEELFQFTDPSIELKS